MHSQCSRGIENKILNHAELRHFVKYVHKSITFSGSTVYFAGAADAAENSQRVSKDQTSEQYTQNFFLLIPDFIQKMARYANTA